MVCLDGRGKIKTGNQTPDELPWHQSLLQRMNTKGGFNDSENFWKPGFPK